MVHFIRPGINEGPDTDRNAATTVSCFEKKKHDLLVNNAFRHDILDAPHIKGLQNTDRYLNDIVIA